MYKTLSQGGMPLKPLSLYLLSPPLLISGKLLMELLIQPSQASFYSDQSCFPKIPSKMEVVSPP